METQYYTVVEKQDFFEIIENKYGELAIFIDARDGSPVTPVLEFAGIRHDRRTAGQNGRTCLCGAGRQR